MEETRQHPALGQEKRFFLALILLGLMAPFCGLALQIAYGGEFLLAGIIIFGLSRIATEVWQILRPELTKRRKHKLASAISILLWTILISLVAFYGESIG